MTEGPLSDTVELIVPANGEAVPLEAVTTSAQAWSDLLSAVTRPRRHSRKPIQKLVSDISRGSYRFALQYRSEDDLDEALVHALGLIMDEAGGRRRAGLVSACSQEKNRQFLQPPHRSILADPMVRRSLRKLYWALSELKAKSFSVVFKGRTYTAEVGAHPVDQFSAMFKAPDIESDVFEVNLELIQYDATDRKMSCLFCGIFYSFQVSGDDFGTFVVNMDQNKLTGAILRCRVRHIFGRVGTGHQRLNLVEVIGWAPYPEYTIRPIPRGIFVEVPTSEPV